jgi:hypothetical protein
LPAKLNRPQIRAIWKMGMNLLSAVCRATGHKTCNGTGASHCSNILALLFRSRQLLWCLFSLCLINPWHNPILDSHNTVYGLRNKCYSVLFFNIIKSWHSLPFMSSQDSFIFVFYKSSPSPNSLRSFFGSCSEIVLRKYWIELVYIDTMHMNSL